jgi:hypothetical protein
MSYENTQCFCGGQKLTNTMLCIACEDVVAGTYDRKHMDDRTASLESRRFAAIRVLAVSRRRLSSTGAPSPVSVSSVCSVGTS